MSSVRVHPLSLTLSLSYFLSPLPFPLSILLLSYPCSSLFFYFNFLVLFLFYSLSSSFLIFFYYLFPLFFTIFSFYFTRLSQSFLPSSLFFSLCTCLCRVRACYRCRRRFRTAARTRGARSWRSTTNAHSEHARCRDVPELAPDILNNITVVPGQTAAAAAAETWPRVVTQVEVALVRQESVALREDRKSVV